MSLQRFVPTPRFDDYRESFKDCYALERSDAGIILPAPTRRTAPSS